MLPCFVLFPTIVHIDGTSHSTTALTLNIFYIMYCCSLECGVYLLNALSISGFISTFSRYPKCEYILTKDGCELSLFNRELKAYSVIGVDSKASTH